MKIFLCYSTTIIFYSEQGFFPSTLPGNLYTPGTVWIEVVNSVGAAIKFCKIDFRFRGNDSKALPRVFGQPAPLPYTTLLSTDYINLKYLRYANIDCNIQTVNVL